MPPSQASACSYTFAVQYFVVTTRRSVPERGRVIPLFPNYTAAATAAVCCVSPHSFLGLTSGRRRNSSSRGRGRGSGSNPYCGVCCDQPKDGRCRGRESKIQQSLVGCNMCLRVMVLGPFYHSSGEGVLLCYIACRRCCCLSCCR